VISRMNLYDQFLHRVELLRDLHFDDARNRLTGLLEWMESDKIISSIIHSIREQIDVGEILSKTFFVRPPEASTLEEVAAVGLIFMERCRNGQEFHRACRVIGIGIGEYGQKTVDEGLERFIIPLLDLIGEKLKALSPAAVAESRFSLLLEDRIRQCFPETADIIDSIAHDFLKYEDDGNWPNIGNSCREALIEFAQEFQNMVGINIPHSIKQGDVKGIARHILKQMDLPERVETTLSKLVDSVWDHSNALLHWKNASREDAIRIYLWTTMVISEFAGLI
jgi:hypothetical protein